MFFESCVEISVGSSYLKFVVVGACQFILLDERTLENKGKLTLTEIFPTVQKHDIQKYR